MYKTLFRISTSGSGTADERHKWGGKKMIYTSQIKFGIDLKI